MSTSFRQLNDNLAALLNHLYEDSILSSAENPLPQGWSYRPLAEICEKIGSGATPRGGKNAYQGGKTALIRSMNVFDYFFSFTDLAHINDDQANKLSSVIVKPYDVLFNITGVSVARCCMVPNCVLPARVNQHVMILRSNNEDQLMNILIMTSLCNDFYKQQLLGIGQSGSTREAINKGEMDAFEIIVPTRSVLEAFGSSAKTIISLINANLLEIEKMKALQSLLLSQLA